MNELLPAKSGGTTPPLPLLEPPAPELVLSWIHEPLVAAARARVRRDAWFGRHIRIAALPARSADDLPEAAIVRDGRLEPVERWSQASLRHGDELLVHVDASDAARSGWATGLAELAGRELPAISIAPFSRTAAGLHRLWCIAAARVLLPARVRVVARHDLLGIRLAQVALGFGADTLAGPIAADRSLPLCGVTRPDETSFAGLATLVRHAGLVPPNHPVAIVTEGRP